MLSGGVRTESTPYYDDRRTTVHGMATTTWDRIGPREKEILSILRRADEPLATREVLESLREEGVDVAYSTVSTILDRLVEKGIVGRERETYHGSTRFRHRFDRETHEPHLIGDVVSDVAMVLGDPGLDALATRAREMNADGPSETRADESPAEDAAPTRHDTETTDTDTH